MRAWRADCGTPLTARCCHKPNVKLWTKELRMAREFSRRALEVLLNSFRTTWWISGGERPEILHPARTVNATSLATSVPWFIECFVVKHLYCDLMIKMIMIIIIKSQRCVRVMSNHSPSIKGFCFSCTVTESVQFGVLLHHFNISILGDFLRLEELLYVFFLKPHLSDSWP